MLVWTFWKKLKTQGQSEKEILILEILDEADASYGDD